MSKHIGIVACSAEGAALCYRTICQEGQARFGEHMHPEVTMHTFPLGRYMEDVVKDDWQGVANLMAASGDKLAQVGAEILICPDNTIHQAFPWVTPKSSVPWLHSSDSKRAELASRLYAQALRLRARTPDDQSPLRVLDLTADKTADSETTGDQLASLTQTINDLAESHLKDQPASDNKNPQSRSRDTHWQAKQLYKRARQLGVKSDDQQVLEQVMRADLGLAQLYVAEQLSDDAFKYLKEAFAIESKITGNATFESNMKALDSDGDGYASLPELGRAVQKAQGRLKKILVEYADKGAPL